MDIWQQLMQGIRFVSGQFDDPDAFYRAHGVNARGIKGWLYRTIMRTSMNKRVTGIRLTGTPAGALRS